MKLAFVTSYDSSNVRAWSGTIFNMLHGFKKSGICVETIDSLRDPYSVLFKAKRVVKNKLFKRNYLRDKEPLTLRSYAKQVERRLGHMKPNIVFSPGTMPIAYLHTDIPMIFWSDATFDGMIGFYPEFTNLCDETISNGRRMEQAALSKCRLAIYCSEWAARTAIENYEVDSKKVKVVPYGANLTYVPSPEEVQEAIQSRGTGVCKLLFVGVDWYRKGGPDALSVTSELNRRGLTVELWVVGCDPPSPLPSYVKTYGFLSKNDPEQNTILSSLYRASDFLLLPSEAESFGIVTAEASAFGLPALTTNVGGLPTAVRDGRNGQTFDRQSFVEACTDYILQILSSKERYHQLCVSSFDEYCERLNWQSAANSVLNLMASEGLLATS